MRPAPSAPTQCASGTPHKRALNAWRAMIRRCTETRQKDYRRYGGAGIKVCPAWMASFERFLMDMGPAPSPTHWLGRLNVLGDYEPGNCAWTTQAQQQRRRAYCRKVSRAGQVMTAAEIGRLPGMPDRNTVLRRLANGLPVENVSARLFKASIWLTHQGETLPVPEWARRIGLPSPVIIHRIRRGWSVERALTAGKFSRQGVPLKSTPV